MRSNESIFLTVKELALRNNLKENWIRNKVFSRKIPFYKIQGLIRFNEREINDWIMNYKKEVRDEI